MPIFNIAFLEGIESRRRESSAKFFFDPFFQSNSPNAKPQETPKIAKT
jgi:hypothetical protein